MVIGLSFCNAKNANSKIGILTHLCHLLAFLNHRFPK